MHGPFLGWGMWIIPGLIIILVYLLVKNNAQSKSDQGIETPLDVLKKRYAKGEITKEQFEQMKKDIS